MTEFSALYQTYTTLRNFLKNSNRLKLIVFDIKKKQLYSSILVDTNQKKLITNGMILKKLKVIIKNKKKHLETSGQNIKKIFTKCVNKSDEHVVVIKGCKYQIFKVIKFIKKYYKKNSLFMF